MTTDPVALLEAALGRPSHEDVDRMREFAVETLTAGGTDPTVDAAGNVLATRGDGDYHLVLNTHLDTVPPHVPFDRDDGVVRGRGACDAKGPLAAMLAAFLDADPDDGRVTLALTPDEETASRGAAALAFGEDALDPDAVVVGEPTGLDVCTAARGRFQATVTLRGEGAHAAEPDAGANAVAALRDVLAAVATFDERSDAPDEHAALEAPTLTPSVVAGGEAANRVPAACEVVLDRRSVPPESAAGFRDDLHAHLQAAARDGVEVSVSLADRETPFLAAFETPTEDSLVRTLRGATGGDVRPFGAATEASYFAAEAPTVVFGPGLLSDDEGPVAHADREYVRAGDVEAAAAALRRAIAGLVG